MNPPNSSLKKLPEETHYVSIEVARQSLQEWKFAYPNKDRNNYSRSKHQSLLLNQKNSGLNKFLQQSLKESKGGEVSDAKWEAIATSAALRKQFTLVIKKTLTQAILKEKQRVKIVPRARSHDGVRSSRSFTSAPKVNSSEFFAPVLRRSKSENFLHTWDMNWKEITTQNAVQPTEMDEKPAESMEDSHSEKEETTTLPTILTTRLMHSPSVVETETMSKAIRKLTKSPSILTRLIDDSGLTSEKAAGKVAIVSGVPKRLIEAITSDDVSEESKRIFLLTFRFFLTPQEFFEKLTERFSWVSEDPQVTSKEKQKVAYSVQLLVLIILRNWVDLFFSLDFWNNKQLLEKLIDFAKNVKEKNSKWSVALEELIERKIAANRVMNLKQIASQMGNIKFETGKTGTNNPNFKGSEAVDWLKKSFSVSEENALIILNQMVEQAFIASTSDWSVLKVVRRKRKEFNKSSYYTILLTEPDVAHLRKTMIDYSAGELAKQLCLIEYENFRNVPLSELSSSNFSKPNKREICPNLFKIVDFANSISYWVATELVSTPNRKKRVSVLRQIISLAQYCRKYNLFSVLFSIIGGLNTAAVMRLKDTWRELPTKYLELYLELEAITNSTANFKVYRELLKTIKFGMDPVVPYIGLMMKDLISYDESGGPTILSNSHVNFKKMVVFSTVLDNLVKCQDCGYSFPFRSDLNAYILFGRSILTEKELMKASRFIEPGTGKIL